MYSGAFVEVTAVSISDVVAMVVMAGVLDFVAAVVVIVVAAVVVIVVVAVVVAVVLIGLETDDILSVSPLKSEEELTVTDAVVVDTDTGWKILSICGTSAIAATTMTAHITSEAGEYINLKFLL